MDSELLGSQRWPLSSLIWVEGKSISFSSFLPPPPPVVMYFISLKIYCSITYGEVLHRLGFPGGSNGKESACSTGDPCLIPGLGRSPGGGNGYPLQYSWLENPMDRGARRATVHGVTRSRPTNKVWPDASPPVASVLSYQA